MNIFIVSGKRWPFNFYEIFKKFLIITKIAMIILLDDPIFVVRLDMTVKNIFSFELFFANDTTIWSFFGMATLMTLE